MEDVRFKANSIAGSSSRSHIMWQRFDFASVCAARCDITFTAAIQITAFLYQIGQKINLSARIS
jgi:hypothetical protein